MRESRGTDVFCYLALSPALFSLSLFCRLSRAPRSQRVISMLIPPTLSRCNIIPAYGIELSLIATRDTVDRQRLVEFDLDEAAGCSN